MRPIHLQTKRLEGDDRKEDEEAEVEEKLHDAFDEWDMNDTGNVLIPGQVDLDPLIRRFLVHDEALLDLIPLGWRPRVEIIHVRLEDAEEEDDNEWEEFDIDEWEGEIDDLPELPLTAE